LPPRSSRTRPGGTGGWRSSGASFAIFVTISFCYFGLAVARHPGRDLIGNGSDPEIFVWSIAWLPHALLHGLNPFYTRAIWAPGGFNLAWAATVPAAGLALAPLSLVVGPVVSFNVVAVLAPALAAWTAYLLCRYLTRAFWPSFLGGYLFGFSSYMLGQEEGHLQMTMVFVVPLVALLVLRFLDGELGGRGLAVQLGILLGLQLGLSIELAFTATLALVVALALGWWLVPERRPRLRSLVLPLAGAYGIGAVLASPLLYFLLTGFQSGSINPPGGAPADLLNFVIPTGIVALSHNWGLSGPPAHFLGNSAENGAYIGLPVLVMVVLFAWRRLGTPGGRFAVASLGVAAFASLGTSLHVDGNRMIWLPWKLLVRLPGFDNALPVRLALFTSLAFAAIVAMWAASRERLWLRVLLSAAAVIAIFPHFGHVPTLSGGYWNRGTSWPQFFSTGLYRACLRPNDTIFTFPFGPRGDSMLWQAETGFRFRLASGYVSVTIPKSFLSAPGAALLAANVPGTHMRDVLRLARDKGITAIIVDGKGGRESARWNTLLSRSITPRHLGGVFIYPLGRPLSPACRAAA
jgi:hypothetical protein